VPAQAGHPRLSRIRPTPGAITGAIETAVRLTMEGKASAIVTNPIAKSVLYDAGFRFPGHTEFLADLGERLTGEELLP
jgi:4-hydroxythreonine-4-phosphate dehydrogenase